MIICWDKLSLLMAFVAAGYAAYAALAGSRGASSDRAACAGGQFSGGSRRPDRRRCWSWRGPCCVKDFRFAYVAQYSAGATGLAILPVRAVGGPRRARMLLWTWLLGLVAGCAFLVHTRHQLSASTALAHWLLDGVRFLPDRRSSCSLRTRSSSR